MVGSIGLSSSQTHGTRSSICTRRRQVVYSHTVSSIPLSPITRITQTNDGGYKIVFDNTTNKLILYYEGSPHKLGDVNIRSPDWQHVNINYFQGAISVSLAGKVVLTHEFTQNYQEFNSRYVGFSATTGASHKIRHLRVHNSDKWLYTKTSNASDITYVSGNVGIGTLTPTELLDVHGNVHIAKDLTVNGNLTVSGTTTFIDTQNLAIEDPIIEVAMGNASDTIDAGLVITRATSNVAVAYRGDEEELALGYTQSGASDTDVTPITDGGLDVRVYGNLFANNLTTTANVEATYLKGNGSEITHVTLDQVVDYGNTTANTIHLTNTDVGLKADGNVDASYFIGNGSKLTGLVTDLQSVTDNGNTTSNTVQFTNATTALIADSNVGIGTSTPSANLHVMGYQYVNGPPTLANAFDHSDAPLTLTHDTATSSTAINDPKPLLHLTRSGTNNESYGARASFNLSRYENSSTHSRSRLDVALADGTYAESTVMTLRADGNVGVGTSVPAYTLDVHGSANVGALTVTSVTGLEAADIPNLDASKITTGTLNNARLPASINVTNVSGDGSGLTSLNADNISSGTLNNARLPASINVTNVSGDGSGLTSLNADNISSGTLNNARLTDASTTVKGIVQLSSSTSGTSTTKAATESAVKAAYDRNSWGSGSFSSDVNITGGSFRVGNSNGTSQPQFFVKNEVNATDTDENDRALLQLKAGDSDHNGFLMDLDDDDTYSANGNNEFVFKIRTKDNAIADAADADTKFVIRPSGRILVNYGSTYKLTNPSDPYLAVNGDISSSGTITATSSVGIGTPSPGFKLHVVGTSYFTNTINIQPSSTGGGQNLFTGYRTGDSYGRARLVLSSGYSDVIIASSQANNNHGSNLSFVTYNPSNAADYRKFVINQGNWGSRKQFLDFGYADKIDPNPHGYINGTDTVLTLDGINKRVGINNINPSYNLDVNGNARINRLHPYSSSYSSAYNTAAIEVREYNMEGSVGGTYWARAPRIGFHWSGRVASQILCESSGQISVVDNPGNNYENFKAKQVSASTAFYAPGHPVQYVGQNVHDIVVYGNSIGRYITPLDITITPKFSNSKIMLHWVINAEAHHDQVIRIYRFISSGASSLIGFNSNNQGVHSGAAPILYDTDHNSTLNTHTVAWVDTPNTTSAVTYRIFTRPSNNGSNWFRLNRTVGGGTLGQANHEIAVSYKSAMEIAV